MNETKHNVRKPGNTPDSKMQNQTYRCLTTKVKTNSKWTAAKKPYKLKTNGNATQTLEVTCRDTRSQDKIKNAAVFGELNMLSSYLKADAGYWFYWKNKRGICVRSAIKMRDLATFELPSGCLLSKDLKMCCQRQGAANIVPPNQ